MRASTFAALALVSLVFFTILLSSPDKTSGLRLRKALRRFDKKVLRKVAKPVKKLFKEVVEKPVKKLLKAVGLKRVRKTYKEFKQEVVHSKVTFTADSYRVEKIVPCPDGQHDIVNAEQPVEIYFEDGVKIIQDRYCRKCGQHFFSEVERKDELWNEPRTRLKR